MIRANDSPQQQLTIILARQHQQNRISIPAREGLLALVGIMVDSNSCKERWNKERKIRCRDPASLSSATIKRENASSHPRLFTLKCDQL